MTRVHLQTPCYSFLVYRLIWYTRHNQPKSLRFKRLTLGHSSYSWQKTATVSPLGAVAPPSSSLVHVWFGTCQLNPWRLQEFFSMLFLRALQTSDLASFWGSFHGVSMMFHICFYTAWISSSCSPSRVTCGWSFLTTTTPQTMCLA